MLRGDYKCFYVHRSQYTVAANGVNWQYCSISTWRFVSHLGVNLRPKLFVQYMYNFGFIQFFIYLLAKKFFIKYLHWLSHTDSQNSYQQYQFHHFICYLRFERFVMNLETVAYLVMDFGWWCLNKNWIILSTH